MKNFIVLNGKTLYFITRDNLEEATAWAQNYANHSKEVIVREIDYIQGQTTLDINGLNYVILD